MLKVVLLELLVPQRKILVVQEVVRQVVANITENATAVASNGTMPAPEDETVSKLPEGRSEGDEEGRGHDKTVLVHW